MPWIHTGEWRYSSIILDLGTGWRRVVSFKHGLLYPRRKSLRYPLDRRLCRPQSRSGGCVGPWAGLDAVGKWRNLTSVGNRTPAVPSVAIPTELSRLLLWFHAKHLLHHTSTSWCNLKKANIFIILEIVNDFKITRYISIYMLIDRSIDWCYVINH
jgi:hypothetical protein